MLSRLLTPSAKREGRMTTISTFGVSSHGTQIGDRKTKNTFMVLFKMLLRRKNTVVELQYLFSESCHCLLVSPITKPVEWFHWMFNQYLLVWLPRQFATQVGDNSWPILRFIWVDRTTSGQRKSVETSNTNRPPVQRLDSNGLIVSGRLLSCISPEMNRLKFSTIASIGSAQSELIKRYTGDISQRVLHSRRIWKK